MKLRVQMQVGAGKNYFLLASIFSVNQDTKSSTKNRTERGDFWALRKKENMKQHSRKMEEQTDEEH